MRFRLRHRARTPILGRFLGANWSQGRLTSFTIRIGPLSWNSRRRNRVRTDLPGGFHGETQLGNRSRGQR